MTEPETRLLGFHLDPGSRIKPSTEERRMDRSLVESELEIHLSLNPWDSTASPFRADIISVLTENANVQPSQA